MELKEIKKEYDHIKCRIILNFPFGFFLASYVKSDLKPGITNPTDEHLSNSKSSDQVILDECL
jgi:hypothetical protein